MQPTCVWISIKFTFYVVCGFLRSKLMILLIWYFFARRMPEINNINKDKRRRRRRDDTMSTMCADVDVRVCFCVKNAYVSCFKSFWCSINNTECVFMIRLASRGVHMSLCWQTLSEWFLGIERWIPVIHIMKCTLCLSHILCFRLNSNPYHKQTIYNVETNQILVTIWSMNNIMPYTIL